MQIDRQIEYFLGGSPFAVVGASANQEKYGNKVLRAYLQAARIAIPVHPAATHIEGIKAYTDLASIPHPVHGISVITPPHVTEGIVAEAAVCGIKHLWIQPGAENEAVIIAAHRHGMNFIAGGPCILVALQYREE